MLELVLLFALVLVLILFVLVLVYTLVYGIVLLCGVLLFVMLEKLLLCVMRAVVVGSCLIRSGGRGIDTNGMPLPANMGQELESWNSLANNAMDAVRATAARNG